MAFIDRNREVTMGRRPWLQVRRVAKILDCHPETIYDLVRDGKLEAIRFGRKAIRISEAKLEEFIEMNKIKPEDF